MGKQRNQYSKIQAKPQYKSNVLINNAENRKK